ncbi:ankyrin repeat protein, putative [Trichomonas vaginalis G3]|uniref:Ankyrin repeat protein, putative n=1 Tax=Trichomonas vaginalis (strain ATCC PRA-98 / G3) TaxID=412133 RepID=A2DLU4_TRIV3|nr:ankyrin repeat and SOCS box-containing protein 4 family [Trichomonas vaginalis G3]EAY18547.1 ankyrin repeat protein, putative [Trichomonas vaginalis G3]KAI5491570.1 ankyrin repeat and SOCS box-containing protein 4 family [Trichomonas vaginalis G3]|eukprot:XP_001579533.1 ankyrin repeat protein [Trichomonas vaginalis G3]
MAVQDIKINQFIELRNMFKYHIDAYIALYQLKTEKEEELNSIYNMIKTELIDSRKYCPNNIIRDILFIIPYNNRYTKSYLYLAKLITNDYHIKEVNHINHISNLLFYKEYGIKINNEDDFENLKSLNILNENTIYRAIMYNDIEMFIAFIEKEGFDENQRLQSKLYPDSKKGYTLLELCCYYGAVDCFKFLRSKFNSEITQKCLKFSFLGKNPEIMSECLKYQEINYKIMKYAIISHNIDFIAFLMNEHQLDPDIVSCGTYNNLESFLIYFLRTNNINKCFITSKMFNAPSVCEYFLTLGADVNIKDREGNTALHIASFFDSKEMAEFLLLHGANINVRDKYGETALHIAAYNNSKETTELLIAHGANVNEKNELEETALHCAASNNSKETAEFLLSHGANINDKNYDGETALHSAAAWNCKEVAELLLSYGANNNEKDKNGGTPLHKAAKCGREEVAKLLLSYGANNNEKDKNGKTALHYAVENNKREMTEFLYYHHANINEKDNYGKKALHYAVCNKHNEIARFLISHGSNNNCRIL